MQQENTESLTLAQDRLPPDLAPYWQRLKDLLSPLPSLIVAFSGGVDSSLLLAAARQALGDRVKAGLCVGDFTPAWEKERARSLARALGVELLEMDARELADPQIEANDRQRCYFCKHLRFSRLLAKAQEMGIEAVAEGSQLDDEKDYRPGMRAKAELGVMSPLAQAGLDKAKVRALSQVLGLPTASVPAGACLASRVPYGRALSPEALARVAQAEGAVRDLLPGQVRVRDEYPMARLELEPDLISRAAAPEMRSRLWQAVEAAGYQGLTLDLRGYRAGGAGEATKQG